MDVIAVHEDFPVGGGKKAGNAVDGSGLPCPIGPQKAETFSGGDVERNAGHGFDATAAPPSAIAFGEIDHLERMGSGRGHRVDFPIFIIFKQDNWIHGMAIKTGVAFSEDSYATNEKSG